MPSTTSSDSRLFADSHLAKIYIPARMASKRLPGKPMLIVQDKPLIHWTYDQARFVGVDVSVVTPDQVIYDYCIEHDICCNYINKDLPNGTARCWDAYMQEDIKYQCIVNWQCDEPLVNSVTVRNLIEESILYQSIHTLVTHLCPGEIDNADVVKAVGSRGILYWFSRGPLSLAWKHTGIYAISTTTLTSNLTPLSYDFFTPTKFSGFEGLEQLGWIENGARIRYIQCEDSININTMKDLKDFDLFIQAVRAPLFRGDN